MFILVSISTRYTYTQISIAFLFLVCVGVTNFLASHNIHALWIYNDNFLSLSFYFLSPSNGTCFSRFYYHFFHLFIYFLFLFFAAAAAVSQKSTHLNYLLLLPVIIIRIMRHYELYNCCVYNKVVVLIRIKIILASAYRGVRINSLNGYYCIFFFLPSEIAPPKIARGSIVCAYETIIRIISDFFLSLSCACANYHFYFFFWCLLSSYFSLLFITLIHMSGFLKILYCLFFWNSEF